MIIEGNKIIADDGKRLVRKADGQVFGEELVLGKTWYIGGVLQDPPIDEKPEDYFDSITIDTSMGSYPVESLDYAYLKAFVVKLKYSNDDQIALMLNYQENPDKYHEAYDAMQAWRDYAGEVARKYSNI